jgi:hypothetical protein
MGDGSMESPAVGWVGIPWQSLAALRCSRQRSHFYIQESRMNSRLQGTRETRSSPDLPVTRETLEREKASGIVRRWYPKARIFWLVCFLAQLLWIPALYIPFDKLERLDRIVAPIVLIPLYLGGMYIAIGCIVASLRLLKVDPDLKRSTRMWLAAFLVFFNFFAGPLIILVLGYQRHGRNSAR